MRVFIIRILIKLLKKISNKRIGIIYHSKDEITKREKNKEAFNIVCEALVKYYDIPFGQLANKTRKRPICEKRQMLHFLAYKYSGFSTIEIGKYTNRSHATVLYSKKAMSNLLETDKHILSQYIDLCNNIEKTLIK